VYAKTDRFYIKKFRRDQPDRLPGDGSIRLDGLHLQQELTKFEYSISLAAALCYLMIHQQDPVGLIAFDQKVCQSLAPGSKRSQLGNILSLLASSSPRGPRRSRPAAPVAGMLRHRSLVMIFSDLLGEPSRSSRPSIACGSRGTT